MCFTRTGPSEQDTRKQLEAAYEADKTSLGIVRPKRVLDLEIREADKEWKPEWKNLFSQMTLFGPSQKPLRKIPYTFHYHFECEDSDKPHVAMCEDWEMGVLFLNEAARLGSDEKAAESVKKKFFGELCREDKGYSVLHGDVFSLQYLVGVGCLLAPQDFTRTIVLDLILLWKTSVFPEPCALRLTQSLAAPIAQK